MGRRRRRQGQSKRRPRPRADLERQYHEQFSLLHGACTAYDSGALHEAKQIALRIRVLAYDAPPRSKSLLGQLGMKDLLFFDTTPLFPPGNLLPTFGLVRIKMGQGPVHFIAPGFDDRLYRDTWMLPFERWWSEEKVIVIPGDFELSRKGLVLAMTNQDGGAHVDSEVDDAYYRLTRENAMGYRARTPYGDVPITEIETASVRQIGQEIMVSLITPWREIPRDLPEPDRPPEQIITKDAETGSITRKEAIRGCPCKNGKAYLECHGAPAGGPMGEAKVGV